MKILSTIRKILLHVCVVCSLVSITAKILDWYNPYMDFSGHVSGLQMVLYFVVILLAVTEGRKEDFREKISEPYERKKVA